MKDPVPLVPVERLLGPQVDVDSQQFLEILNEAGVVPEASPGLPIDEKVLVARLMGFSTSYRAEDTHIPRAVATDKAYDLLRFSVRKLSRVTTVLFRFSDNGVRGEGF